jgi:hypothetical protein
MSDRQRFRIHSILSHEQPSREALLNIVQPITRGCLGNLHTPNCGIAAQRQLQVWSGFQGFLQSPGLYPRPISRDLYHRLKGAPAQANRRQCSSEALIAYYASLGRFSIVHYDDKRNHSSIREVRKFQLSTRLVNDKMVWQADVFEMRTK